ncbi:MAG: hypothetical protein WD039_06455, partial [Xanthobacteraceae bacterium]
FVKIGRESRQPTERTRKLFRLAKYTHVEMLRIGLTLFHGKPTAVSVNMTDISNSMRMNRGFHRIGIVLAIVLATCTLAIGAFVSSEDANSKQRRFSALQCADEKLKAKFVETSPSPSQIKDEHDYELLALGAVFIDPEGKKRQKLPNEIPIGKMGCGYSFSTASREEVANSQNVGFSYGASLASGLGITALITSLVGLLTYLLVMTSSWIVRGFMRSP